MKKSPPSRTGSAGSGTAKDSCSEKQPRSPVSAAACILKSSAASTRRLPGCLILNLSQFYGVPVSDFLDEYNQFLFDGQAKRIKDYRKKLGMERKPFCRHTGIPLSSLRGWEDGKKEVSFKCWEQYFKGKA